MKTEESKNSRDALLSPVKFDTLRIDVSNVA